MGIINALWGSGELKGKPLGKWWTGIATFVAVFACYASWEYALVWAVGFLIFRTPSLSKHGFKAFDGNYYQKIDAFFYLTCRSLLLLPPLVYYCFKNYEVIYIMPMCMLYGWTYSVIGWTIGNKTYTPRLAEYVAAMWIGLIILLTWRLVGGNM
jgi:hypothetical protein